MPTDLTPPPPPAAPPLSPLGQARARLQPPVRRRAAVWPALLSAFAAASAALAAAAAVILGAPALGAPSTATRPPVSHVAR